MSDFARRQSICRRVVTGLALAAPLAAAPGPQYLREQTQLQNARSTELSARRLKRNHRLWLLSIPVLIAGNALDAHSSWGKPEANALLQGAGGRFEARGMAIKFGITGALVGAQFIMNRRLQQSPASLNSAYLGWSVSNLAFGSTASVIAWRNYRIQ